MEKIYIIREFNLIGKVIFTYKEIEVEKIIEVVENSYGKKIYAIIDGSCGEFISNRYCSYSLTKKGLPESEEFLPYYADVTQDVPASYKGIAKTYKNCQLMSEKHGGYLQFFHPPTKEVLRIAMNSHFYVPVA